MRWMVLAVVCVCLLPIPNAKYWYMMRFTCRTVNLYFMINVCLIIFKLNVEVLLVFWDHQTWNNIFFHLKIVIGLSGTACGGSATWTPSTTTTTRSSAEAPPCSSRQVQHLQCYGFKPVYFWHLVSISDMKKYNHTY